MTVQMYSDEKQSTVPVDNNRQATTTAAAVVVEQSVEVTPAENVPTTATTLLESDHLLVSVDSEDANSSQTATQTEQVVHKSSPVRHQDRVSQINLMPSPPTFATLLPLLEDRIAKSRWTISMMINENMIIDESIIPCKEFETLLDMSLAMIQAGQDESDAQCHHFATETVTQFFLKFYDDEILERLKIEVVRNLICISFKMVQLAILCLKRAHPKTLELLTIMFSPHHGHGFSSFTFNHNEKFNEEYVHTHGGDDHKLVLQLLNHFAQLDGFNALLACFQCPNLSLSTILNLLKPFNACIEFLTNKTIESYFVPVLRIVSHIIENLSDEDLKKEVKNEFKNDNISLIIKVLRNISLRLPDCGKTVEALELLKLKVILRLLQISSFNGKMNALNELNRAITSYSNDGGHNNGPVNCFAEYMLSSAHMAQWLVENKVLDIVMKDCLHQPQYVEKLENIIRFLIKKDALSLDYLDKIWNCQIGKHEIIVKNVHDLIAKLAWSFSSDQLNHLLVCFQSSWAHASKKEREKLLELMRRLAEDDKDGSMAYKVLGLLWDIAYSDDDDLDIIDLALTAHFKILDYGRTSDKDEQKIHWIERCIVDLKKFHCGSNNVLPALKHIREICRTFPSSAMNSKSKIYCKQTNSKVTYRHELMAQMQEKYKFFDLVVGNLASYMEHVSKLQQTQDVPYDPLTIYQGRRFSHVQEVQERLNFLRFILQEGQMWMGIAQGNAVWQSLAQNAVFPQDRQMCFRWFTSLLENQESDFDPEEFGQFFEQNILKLDPSLVDIDGIECFQRFFQTVNYEQSKLLLKNSYLMNDCDLIGIDYLWKLILNCDNEAAQKAIGLLIGIYTSLGPNLLQSQVDVHRDLITTCFDRLKVNYDTLLAIENDPEQSDRVASELRKMTRSVSVLYEYIAKCDADFGVERTILPMAHSYRGDPVPLLIKVLNFGRNTEELEMYTHLNESLNSIRKKILSKFKLPGTTEVEFSILSDKIDSHNTMVIGQLPFVDRLNLTARLIHSNTNISCTEVELRRNYLKNLSYVSSKKEITLPGVMISQQAEYFTFVFQIADTAMSMKYFPLQEKCLSLLKLVPADVHLVQAVKRLCQEQMLDDDAIQHFESQFFSSPTKTVYLLGLIYALLMPATTSLAVETQEFQMRFINSRCGLRMLKYLILENGFLDNADKFSKACGILVVLKICKFVLASLTYLKVFTLSSAINLNEVLQVVPSDYILRKVSMNTAQNIRQTLVANDETKLLQLVNFTASRELISSVVTIAFATATGSFEYIDANCDLGFLNEIFHSKEYATESEVSLSRNFNSYQVCHEAIELLTILFMLSPQNLQEFIENQNWENCFINLLLFCKQSAIRNAMMDQFTIIITKCSLNEQVLNQFIKLLFKCLQHYMPTYSYKSAQYFQLYCNLLNHVHESKHTIPFLHEMLHYELTLLNQAQTQLIHYGTWEDTLLEGHLKVTKELVMLVDCQAKHSIGYSKNDNEQSAKCGIVDLLLDKFLFTASKCLYLLEKTDAAVTEVEPICNSSATFLAAYELLIALCTGCYENLLRVNQALESYFHNFAITDWEFYPAMGTRPQQSFVGLKNAGATCYMNSVLQQLFMIEEIRNGLLSVDTGSEYQFEDCTNEEPFFHNSIIDSQNSQEDSKTYNIGILKQIQIIFGHLALSKCQYYVPKGFWKQFKLLGGPINLREQHDALEFFNSLVDSLDEALKSLSQPPLMSNIFGGTFADQKICKGCPHRYSREESFTALNVDIRNHNSLVDSLEQYVKGDLLEGDNAYYCEKCDRKVDTVKRLCIKKLPTILAIQLKRFDYDYERESAIKFNDYFEFPRLLDMQPYTVNGLAQMEGEVIEEDLASNQDANTNYELTGIVVHSGQASGGHYYSFIQHQNGPVKKWYKFDDGDVSEWKLDDDDEMKGQCFGGEYVSEVFDQMLKKMPQRTKRWWNAFILVYRRLPTKGQEDTIPVSSNTNSDVVMPLAIKRNVLHSNVRFMHQRNQFSEEFYYFIRQLIQCNKRSLADSLDLKKLERIVYTTLNLASKFLFSLCFRTKKALRINAIEWYDILTPYLKMSSSVRMWFLEKHLLESPNMFSEFLLECPAPDVRYAFSKLIIFLTHYALIDRGDPNLDVDTRKHAKMLSDRVMHTLVHLLRKEVPEHSNNLAQYFHMFFSYASLGVEERRHLLQFEVPAFFMLTATDEGPGYPSKYQFVDFTKLYQVVSILIRCCDVSDKCQAFYQGESILPNPFGYEENVGYIMPIQPQAYDVFFNKKNYLKKIIKEANGLPETYRLLQFCCWENITFSLNALSELLYYLSNSYPYELRPYFDLLQQLLTLEDSWQEYRLKFVLNGEMIDENHHCENLFELLQNHKHHLEKRAYQCVKFMSHLFTKNEIALNILKSDPKLKVIWIDSVNWLHESLNYSPTMHYMPYNNWSVQSNETSNSYTLERSNSADQTLAIASRVLPPEDISTDATGADYESYSGSTESESEQSATLSPGNNENEFEGSGKVKYDNICSEVHNLVISENVEDKNSVVTSDGKENAP